MIPPVQQARNQHNLRMNFRSEVPGQEYQAVQHLSQIESSVSVTLGGGSLHLAPDHSKVKRLLATRAYFAVTGLATPKQHEQLLVESARIAGNEQQSLGIVLN
jgi:hypothetical protein